MGWRPLPLPGTFERVCASLSVLVGRVFQDALVHRQFALDPGQSGADVVQEAAADQSTLVVVVVELLLQGFEHALLRSEADAGRRGAALVHEDAGVHFIMTSSYSVTCQSTFWLFFTIACACRLMLPRDPVA